jgi:hypothetical protein
MSDLRDKLVTRLEQLPNVKVAFWQDTDLLCVFHNGKEIAHFQNEAEIDIRLTPGIIKQRGLTPPKHTSSHLDRSKNSRWIVQSFTHEAELDDIVMLLQIAIDL